MTRLTKFKASIFQPLLNGLLGAASLFALAACKAPAAPSQDDFKTIPAAASSKLPPLKKALACLPQDAAIIAAHRGTDERWTNTPENSIGGLNALIAHGTHMAEIDVAGLRDGTLITFHDGVWDEISTGKGPIASARKGELENILLKSRSGKLTAERPPLFSDMLKTAKGN